MVVDGFPVQIGSLPRAYRKGALSAPDPGNKPAAIGNVLKLKGSSVLSAGSCGYGHDGESAKPRDLQLG